MSYAVRRPALVFSASRAYGFTAPRLSWPPPLSKRAPDGRLPLQRVMDFTRFTRGDWLGVADRFYARLDRTVASLSAADWERTTPYLGWRARDVLAHMTSAMPVNFRQVLDRALAGNPAAPPEIGRASCRERVLVTV